MFRGAGYDVLRWTIMKKAEQLPRRRPLSYWLNSPWPSMARMRHRSGSRFAAKRLANRQRRRAEVRDPENVPNRFTRGWYD
jgi:hypothetical protein